MKAIKVAAAFVAITTLAHHNIVAVTADDLATFLDIHSWKTRVAAPIKALTIEIRLINNGEVRERVLFYPTAMNQEETDIDILIGLKDGDYKVAIIAGSSQVSFQTSVSQFKGTVFAPKLPNRIRSGDFVLLGDIKGGVEAVSPEGLKRATAVSSYSKGFLLRVKEKD